MTDGGDERILIDPVTGLNRYMTAPRPQNLIAYSSSTANFISAPAMAEVQRRMLELAPGFVLEPAAYARIIPPGICYEESSIGRVVTNPEFRKNGFGKELMQLAIEKTLSQFQVTSIKIGAQAYLLDFYGNLGFVSTGKHYLEDGIQHVEMLLTK